MQGETLDELPSNMCSDTSSVYGRLSAPPGAAVAKMIAERTGAKLDHLSNQRNEGDENDLYVCNDRFLVLACWKKSPTSRANTLNRGDEMS